MIGCNANLRRRGVPLTGDDEDAVSSPSLSHLVLKDRAWSQSLRLTKSTFLTIAAKETVRKPSRGIGQIEIALAINFFLSPDIAMNE